MDSKLIITPHTNIAELLETFPQLEDTLIDLAPTFEKLKNPALRRTIAGVTSLKQVASMSELPLEVIINKLRGIVGQEEMTDVSGTADNGVPEWFSTEKVTKSFDARETIAQGGHPLGDVMGDLMVWAPGDIYELITPFLPAPLVDKVKDLGFEAWTKKENDGLFRNYFCKI